jgi:hypothetical protein
MGTILKQNFSIRSLPYSCLAVKKFQIPSITKEAGVSPGWTLDEIKIVGLSNLKGRVDGSPFASGKSPSIRSSLSSVILSLAVKVMSS